MPPSTAEILALEEVAALGWPAIDQDWLGRWLLRAADGWTRRANSVLPLGDPGVALDEALARVEGWYRDRGLAARFQLPLAARPALDLALAERGWAASNRTLVLVADLPAALARAEPRDLPPVELSGQPSPAWLAAYHYRDGNPLPPLAPRILAGPDRRVFAAVTIDDAAVAIARAVVTKGWAGVTAVEVSPPWRRRGLGRRVTQAVLAWAHREGATSAYVQVAEENEAALTMYDRMRFRVHHRYVYRQAPAS